MKAYASNLTDSQWEIIKQLLEDQRKRKYSLRVMVDAILYITKTGVQWRMLPRDFPSWQLVYYYFRKWSYTGLTEQIHDRLLTQVREKKGRPASPSLGLVDSQSVKTASLTQQKGLDGNKKISGRKRFIVTDTIGLILAIFITPANLGESRTSVARNERKISAAGKNSSGSGLCGSGFCYPNQAYIWLGVRNSGQSSRSGGISSVT
jgi:putative transposase